VGAIASGSGTVSLEVAGESVLGGNADKTLQVEERTKVVLNGDVTAGSANRERFLRFFSAGEVEINGLISGSGSNPFGVLQTALAGQPVPQNGTLILNNFNVYDGLTRVSAGTLKLGNSLALGGTTSGTLLNVALENVGTETEASCPICEEHNLRLVTYVFGHGLPAQGRCVSTAKEMRQVSVAGHERRAYVVEACCGCRWHHLLRVYPV
jgi:autotransporter-associated beta strand protein